MARGRAGLPAPVAAGKPVSSLSNPHDGNPIKLRGGAANFHAGCAAGVLPGCEVADPRHARGGEGSVAYAVARRIVVANLVCVFKATVSR